MKSMCLRMLPLSLASTFLFSFQSLAATSESRVVVEAVECRGNVSIPCDFIRRRLRLQPNSEVDDEAVQSAQLRLSALANFESVRVYLEKGSERGQALLIVEVVEANAIVTDFTMGARYFSSERFSDSNGSYQLLDQWSEIISGRIGDLNLFGSQKIGELGIKGYHAEDDSSDYNNLSASLNYIDPHLFGIDRLFASVSGNYYFSTAKGKSAFQSYDPMTDQVFDGEVHIKSSGRGWASGVSVGYKLWQYSYVLAGFSHAASKAKQSVDFELPGVFLAYSDYTAEDSRHSNHWRLGYGWDSEDDTYFPTRGSRLSANVTYSPFTSEQYCDCHELDWRLAYKYTRMFGRSSVWSINVGGEPAVLNDRLRPTVDFSSGLAITYAHLLPASETFGGIRRGRWYIQLGTGPVDISRDGHIGGQPSGASAVAGLSFESKSLGIVNLYAAANRFLARSGQ